MKCLIVDDVFMMRKLLNTILQEFGECVLAEDGENALKIFENAIKVEKPFDLVCLDIMMPHINGVELLNKIRNLESKNEFQNKPKVKIILISAVYKQNIVDKIGKDKFDSYITKPIGKADLISEIKKLGLVN